MKTVYYTTPVVELIYIDYEQSLLALSDPSAHGDDPIDGGED